MYFKNIEWPKQKQQEIYDQENIYEQKFQVVLLQLGVANDYKRKYYQNHQEGGLFNYYLELPKPSEIKALFRYGESGLDYLGLRVRAPTQFPSVIEGLDRLEEMYELLNPVYFRILPYFVMVQVANFWGNNWADLLQYGYIPYAKNKQDRNWTESSGKYERFSMKHGNSNNLQVNYFQNSAKNY